VGLLRWESGKDSDTSRGCAGIIVAEQDGRQSAFGATAARLTRIERTLVSASPGARNKQSGLLNRDTRLHFGQHSSRLEIPDPLERLRVHLHRRGEGSSASGANEAEHRSGDRVHILVVGML